MNLRAQAIFIRMSCNVVRCKLHSSTTCSCNRRSQFIVVMEIWAKVIIYTVTKFVIFVHILLEINFSCYLSTGIDFTMTWSRFLIIPEFLLGVYTSRYRENRFLGFCTFRFLKYKEVCNLRSYTSPTLGLLSSGFQMNFEHLLSLGITMLYGINGRAKGYILWVDYHIKLSFVFMIWLT